MDHESIEYNVAMQIEQKIVELCGRIFTCKQRLEEPLIWPGAEDTLQRLYYEQSVWEKLLQSLED